MAWELRRLGALCIKGGGYGLPRKTADRRILLMSVVLTLRAGRAYTEAELNEALEGWLADIGQAVEIDHVSLRRELVDDRFIERDAAGERYRVADAAGHRFEEAVAGLAPGAIVARARQEQEARRRQYGG